MEAMEALAFPQKSSLSSFPAGYSFQFDGSYLYLALARFFVAQLQVVAMSWKQQIFMVATLCSPSKRSGRRARVHTPLEVGAAARRHVPFAGRTDLCRPRIDCLDGHGADLCQCSGQLGWLPW